MNQDEHAEAAKGRDKGADASELDERIRRARARNNPESQGAAASQTQETGWAGTAFRMGIEVSAALAVGTILGLSLDRWLGTGPWLLILFFFLGSGAGVMNVYRASRGMGYSVGYGQSDKDGPPGGQN